MAFSSWRVALKASLLLSWRTKLNQGEPSFHKGCMSYQTSCRLHAGRL